MSVQLETNNEFTDKKVLDQFVLKCIDKLITILPDYDYFYLHKSILLLEDDPANKRKVKMVYQYIRNIMVELNYIEVFQDSNTHKLTNTGRTAKQKGGHFKYQKSLKPRWTSHQIVTTVVSVIAVIVAMLSFTINYIEKSKSDKKNEEMKNKINVLNDRLEKIENRKPLN